MNKKYKEISLKTSDRVSIRANYYEKSNTDSVIVIAPGWCMTKDSDAFRQIANFFSDYYSVLSFDFRGHGKSSGFYTFGAKEINDMDAVVKFLNKYENIYLFGFSLGSMVSLIYGAESQNIRGIVAVSAPADFDKIENKMWRREAWEETFRKFELARFLSIRPSLIPHKKLKPIDIVDKITVPTLFIAGEKDPTVCSWHTKSLYDKATCQKKLKIFEDGIHAEDIFLHFKNEFTTTCLNWLNQK